jgi:serine/threonine protein kinase
MNHTDNIAVNIESEPARFNPPIIDQGDAIYGTLIEASGTCREIKCLRSRKSGNTYEVQTLLKKAIYGEVWHGKLLKLLSGTTYEENSEAVSVAIKIISRSKMIEIGASYENPLSEIAAMQHIGSHHNISELIECIGTSNSIFMVMSFCNGKDLMDVLQEKKGRNGPVQSPVLFEESKARSYFNDLVTAVEHLQSKNICHRDLSLENIMLHNDKCVIIDMGMCIKVPVISNTNCNMLIKPQGVCGKNNYIPPEIVANTVSFETNAVDSWQLGIILFSLVTGFPPIERACMDDQRYALICEPDGFRRLVAVWRLAMSPSLMDLLSALLHPTARCRPSIAAIRQMNWMNVCE